MESGIQSSFIPKDAAPAVSAPRRADTAGLSEIFLLVAIVLLVASLALAGAVFLYKQYVHSSAESKVEQLQRAKAAFEPSLIQELTRLDDRMHAADIILKNHIAPTAFFRALEQTTLATVAFQSLTFLATEPQRMTVKLSGVARGVNSIALEGDIFSKSGVITNPIFSDISRQSDGVRFTLSAIVNPIAINYVQLLSGANVGVPGASQESIGTGVPLSPFGQSPNTGTSQGDTQGAPAPQSSSTVPAGAAQDGGSLLRVPANQ